MAKIKEDIDVGEKVGVTGTPAIFINGVKMSGGSFEILRLQILEKLGG